MTHIHWVTVISEPLSAFVRPGTPSTGVMDDPARTPFIASSARPWSLRPQDGPGIGYPSTSRNCSSDRRSGSSAA
jgi:hypothetical protein